MTPDLLRLRESLPALGPIVEQLELELVDDPRWSEPSDTSYLSDAERANPDIASNVAAMAATNQLISWFGRDAEGYLGLWHGPEQRAATAAPVLRLDTEGQYSIVAPSVPEYLAIAMPEDAFASTREALTRAGFNVAFNPDAIWAALDAFNDDPNAYRNELYEQHRVERGLPRSDQDDAEPEAAATDAAASDVDGGWADAPASEPVPAAQVAAEPAKQVAPKQPAKEAAAPKPAKATAKQPAKKAAAKPTKQAAAKKAAAKPAKKAAAKKAAKPAKKAASKKAAAKPAKKATKKAAPKKAAAKRSAPAKKAGKKPAGKPKAKARKR